MPPEVGQVSELSAAIAGIATLVILALGAVAWRRVAAWAERAGADLRATKTQTTNGHKTNLRDDVTRIENKVDEAVRAVRETSAALAAVAKAGEAAHEDVRELRKDVRFALEYARDATEYARDVDKRVADVERAGT